MNEQQLINDLFHALMNGNEFNAETENFKITANKSDNTISINVKSIEPEDATKKEVDEFNQYCERIPDEMFLEICEDLASDKLMQIQDCINSKNIDSVRSGIIRFKQAVRDYVNNKIDEITDETNKQIEYYNSFLND